MKSRHEAVSRTDEINLNLSEISPFVEMTKSCLKTIQAALCLFNLLPFQEYLLQQSGFLR